jgi:peptidoglycan hydrolase CwlO-like protein
MNRVKEEFYLSVIFVGKWLALGLGVIFLISFGINYAYHKSYYDPMMQKFDFEIKQLNEKKKNLEIQSVALSTKHKELEQKISKIEKSDIPLVEEKIYKANNEIDNLQLRFWERCEIPLVHRSDLAEKKCQAVNEAEKERSSLNTRLESLNSEKDQINAQYQNLSSEIVIVSGQITQKEQDKRKAEVDVKGPILWLIGILGLGLS